MMGFDVHTSRTRWLGGALALLVALPAALSGQFVEPPPPAAYALENATLVRADGERRSGVTVVVRDGLIEALGDDVETPPDARVLEGDSLFVYPGIVDAEGVAEFELPSPDDDEVLAWAPTRAQQGFTPHLRVVDHLTGTGEDFESRRRKGVVASAVHPEGSVLPGRGALLLHRPEATTPAEMVLRPVLGPAISFDRGRAYPRTLFGVIAFLRQRFEDAERHQRVLTIHAEDPRGITAPKWDPDLEVLRAAVERETPVFFRAHGAENIRRVLDLAERYGFRPLIVGGDEAWKVADRLRERNVPVLVSLDFPEPERWSPEGEEEEEEPREEEEREEREEPEEEVREQQEEAPDPAALRERRRLEAIYANAGRLAEAGVSFALTSGGGEADLREGARKAIEYGLSEEDALRALTVRPASLLGVPSLVDVGTRFPANLTVTDGALFADESSIVYTFVEGRLERGGEQREAPEEPPAVDMSGEWDVEVESPQGTFSGTMTLNQSGAFFDGRMTADVGSWEIRDGVVSGNDVTFTVVVDAGDQTFRLAMEGTATEDEAEGTGKGPEGASLDWSATRTTGPGAGR